MSACMTGEVCWIDNSTVLCLMGAQDIQKWVGIFRGLKGCLRGKQG